jgi:hypothetical protein
MAGPVGDRAAIGGSTRAIVLTMLLGVLALGAVRPWLEPTGAPGPAAGGIDLSARVAARPPGGDPGLVARIPAVSLTSALRDLAAHAAIGGPDLSRFGEPDAIERGQPLAVLRRASDAAGTTWLRIYVLPHGNRASGYFAWIPATSAGEALVDAFTERPCPPAPDNLSFLAWLDPFTRARCLGAASLAIQGRTGLATWAFGSGDPYDVAPAWMGGPADAAGSAVAVVDPVNGALILRIPPGLPKPPPDITIRASVHVADPVSGECRRVDDSGSLPPEAAADSALWCSVQLVVERWEPLLGPEARPFDATAPQLHRASAGGACLLVGMGSLRFRIDPSQLDPVWLEAPSGGPPILALFTPGFRFAFVPEPVVVDAAGVVVARDGQAFTPGDRIAGHFTCGTGWSVIFD